MLDVPHPTRGRCRVLDRTTPSPHAGAEHRSPRWRDVLGIRMRYIRQEMGIQLDFGHHSRLWDVGSEQSQLCRTRLLRGLVVGMVLQPHKEIPLINYLVWSRRQPTSRYVPTISQRYPADDQIRRSFSNSYPVPTPTSSLSSRSFGPLLNYLLPSSPGDFSADSHAQPTPSPVLEARIWVGDISSLPWEESLLSCLESDSSHSRYSNRQSFTWVKGGMRRL